MSNEQGMILLVEDDSSIRRGLSATLTALSFDIGEAASGEEALNRLHQVNYDVVLMDLNMPGMGGVEACRRIRKEFPQICIVVVTVRDNEEDKIEALDAGADDYLTKPFQVGELTARMRAVLRRSQNPPPTTEESIHVGIFDLQPARRVLKKRSKEVRLTPTEFDLLAYLMAHAGHPILHSKLLSSVWGPEYGDEREYLRTFILQLRKKLEDDPGRPAYLRTVNYLGYVFSEPTSEDGQEDISTK